MAETNNILSQAMEIRLFLESKMKEDYTNEEIYTLLAEKFPFVKNVKVKDIAAYRRILVPNYQKHIIESHKAKLQTPAKIESDIEKEILEQVKQVEEVGYEFTKKGEEKVDTLKAHRFLLAETWTNYTGVRGTDDEKSKTQYVTQLMQILSEIKELESSEKSLLSALGEIRAKEQLMSADQYSEHIKTWCILRCAEKCKSREELTKVMDEIKMFIDNYMKIASTSDNAAEANRIALESFYVTKKVYNEVKST